MGKSGVGVQISMAKDSRMRVEIYCSNDSDKRQFDLLFSHKAAIEVHFPGETISWEKLDGNAASRIALYRPYEKDKATDDTPHRKELFEWISKRVTIFRAIARQFLIDA